MNSMNNLIKKVFRNTGAVDEPREKRASDPSYTQAMVTARNDWLTGSFTGSFNSIGGISGAEATATVQTAVNLWASGLGRAEVSGTHLLNHRVLTIIARSLALKGEALFLIDSSKGKLIPCINWDISTYNGEPTAYAVTIPEIHGNRRETVLAGEVMHFRIGSEPSEPWKGSAPINKVPLTASLMATLETVLGDVFRDAPIGSQIVHVPEGTTDDMGSLRRGFKGNRGAALVIEGVAQATAAGMNPNIGQKPDQLTPDLDKTMADRLLGASQSAILSAYGILPALTNPSATGPIVREAQRHLAQWVLQPIADTMAEEASFKLGSPVTIDCIQPMQAFDTGGRARAFGALVKAMADAKESGLNQEETAKLLEVIGWNNVQQ